MIKEDVNKTVMQFVRKMPLRVLNFSAVMLVKTLGDVCCRAVVIGFVF